METNLQLLRNVRVYFKRTFMLLAFATMFFAWTSVHAQPMSGAYSVCLSGCNYSKVGDAVDALKSKGVSGAVFINIGSGTFTETVSIPAITGASATNLITFKGK